MFITQFGSHNGFIGQNSKSNELKLLLFKSS